MPATGKPAGPTRAPKGVAQRHIPLELPPRERDRISEHAQREHRTTAAFARLLVNRGLAAYQLDQQVIRKVSVQGAMSRRQIALRLLPEERAAVEHSAQEEQRSLVSMTRLLTLAGLADYEAETAGVTES